ncbi:hypothetical protein [Nonomuraea dietziae]|uniref:hypothetical protein n=1 Tax=Nonomuraea dietziae TaxID=65515 RepID=UPI0034307471
MPGLVKELRRARTEQVRAQHPDDFAEMASWEVGDLLDELANALLLTGVGVITGPAAAVTWMTGRDVNRRWAEDPDVAQVCRVAATRPSQWRRDVAVRLAQRVRRPADRIAPLAVALLRESGAVPPDHDPLVAAWLAAPSVAGDPLTPLLLPRVFAADGAGRALRDERLEPRPTRWLAAAARELPRKQVLDGCMSRFLRGGEAQDLRFFVRLHMLLDPTPAESAPRLRDYLRLLPTAPGTVAELAAGQVRRAMPLEHADLVEAVDALTFRDEAKLAATGLRWLDQAIRATPEAAADFVTALTTAYAHKSFDEPRAGRGGRQYCRCTRPRRAGSAAGWCRRRGWSQPRVVARPGGRGRAGGQCLPFEAPTSDRTVGHVLRTPPMTGCPAEASRSRCSRSWTRVCITRLSSGHQPGSPGAADDSRRSPPLQVGARAALGPLPGLEGRCQVLAGQPGLAADGKPIAPLEPRSRRSTLW